MLSQFLLSNYIAMVDVIAKLTVAKIGLTSAIKLIKITIYPIKIKGHTNTHTPSCVGK